MAITSVSSSSVRRRGTTDRPAERLTHEPIARTASAPATASERGGFVISPFLGLRPAPRVRRRAASDASCPVSLRRKASAASLTFIPVETVSGPMEKIGSGARSAPSLRARSRPLSPGVRRCLAGRPDGRRRPPPRHPRSKPRPSVPAESPRSGRGRDRSAGHARHPRQAHAAIRPVRKVERTGQPPRSPRSP